MNFSQPTRQDPLGIIANALFVIQRFLRAFFPLILIIFIKDTSIFSFAWLWWLIPFMVLVLFWAFLNYKNFFFYIDKASFSFVVESGVINKSKITIQLDKIQQVNINQSFINRLVGVYAVEIDSGGSKDKEVEIQSISYEVAESLKQTLLGYTSEDSNISSKKQEVISKEKEERTISFLTLLKVGLTSNYLQTLGLILVFFISLYDRYFSALLSKYIDEEDVGAYLGQGFNKFILLYVLFFLMVLVLSVNVIRTFFKFFNYKIALQNNTLFLSHGLFATRSTIIHPKRVQIIQIAQNYFQKKLGLFEFKIKQITGHEFSKEKSALEIPGCTAEEKDDFLEMIMGEWNFQPRLILKPNYRFFVFRFFVFGIIPVALINLLSYTDYEWNLLFLYSLIYLVIIGLVVYRLFKVKELKVLDNFIILKSGFWDVTETILEPNKIQKLTISQYFWHSKNNIGSINIYTAGGIVRFQTTSYDQLNQLMDLWLYQVESSPKSWM